MAKITTYPLINTPELQQVAICPFCCNSGVFMRNGVRTADTDGKKTPTARYVARRHKQNGMNQKRHNLTRPASAGFFLFVTRFFLPCRAIRAILRLSVGNDASDEPEESNERSYYKRKPRSNYQPERRRRHYQLTFAA